MVLSVLKALTALVCCLVNYGAKSKGTGNPIEEAMDMAKCLIPPKYAPILCFGYISLEIYMDNTTFKKVLWWNSVVARWAFSWRQHGGLNT